MSARRERSFRLCRGSSCRYGGRGRVVPLGPALEPVRLFGERSFRAFPHFRAGVTSLCDCVPLLHGCPLWNRATNNFTLAAWVMGRGACCKERPEESGRSRLRVCATSRFTISRLQSEPRSPRNTRPYQTIRVRPLYVRGRGFTEIGRASCR